MHKFDFFQKLQANTCDFAVGTFTNGCYLCIGCTWVIQSSNCTENIYHELTKKIDNLILKIFIFTHSIFIVNHIVGHVKSMTKYTSILELVVKKICHLYTAIMCNFLQATLLKFLHKTYGFDLCAHQIGLNYCFYQLQIFANWI